ncbi:MAG: SAM hydrolase/SAM-dependent halogenase family protein [Bacteroidota bacterium]
MPIITLTTDWGNHDFYGGAVKGRLLKALPDITIVDISHQVKPHNIVEAAFILRHAYAEFPEGTIHIASVDATASRKSPHVVASINGHYFIGADNGLLSMISDKEPERIIELDIPQDSNYFVFPTRDVFVKAAIHLARSKPLDELGFATEHLKKISSWSASSDKNPENGHDRISGQIIHIDNYGNCLSNIDEDLFMRLRRNRPFLIHIPFTSFEQQRLYDAYDDVDEGNPLALMSGTGFLQIAVNQGYANRLLGLKAYESSILIEFLDS